MKYELEKAVYYKNKIPRRHFFFFFTTVSIIMIAYNKKALKGLTCSKIIHAAITLLMTICFYDNIL